MSESVSQKPPAEFDEYAEGYDAGMENPLKRFAGGSAEDFIEIKADWLRRDLEKRPLSTGRAPAETAWLDFGCGTGVFLRILDKYGCAGAFHGCDVSASMLDEARAAWTLPRPVKFDVIGADGRVPYADESFDVVLASAVLHHVPIAERPGVYREVARVLRPGGRFYVFEHNPWNPVTQWVVSHTAIDQNAILLAPGEVRQGMRAAGLSRDRSSALMFFPPRWRWTWQLERAIRWLPLGGQYAASADKATKS